MFSRLSVAVISAGCLLSATASGNAGPEPIDTCRSSKPGAPCTIPRSLRSGTCQPDKCQTYVTEKDKDGKSRWVEKTVDCLTCQAEHARPARNPAPEPTEQPAPNRTPSPPSSPDEGTRTSESPLPKSGRLAASAGAGVLVLGLGLLLVRRRRRL